MAEGRQEGGGVPELGYGSREYAESLARGTPIHLSSCDGWIIRRQLDSGDRSIQDLIGPYPVFDCLQWSLLGEDIDRLGENYLSISMVITPFADITEGQLAKAFPDVCYPFKQHFVTRLDHDWSTHVSSGHRRNARKALKELRVEHTVDPSAYLEDWVSLYENLEKRHQIGGQAKFTRSSFKDQLRLPGMRATIALQGGTVVGMVLWYLSGNIAYYHLGAYSEVGYSLRASFGIFYEALEWLRSDTEFLSLGAAAGIDPSETDGLTRFKAGWSTDTRPAYFCGRIIDHESYHRRVGSFPSRQAKGYFPAYAIDD